MLHHIYIYVTDMCRRQVRQRLIRCERDPKQRLVFARVAGKHRNKTAVWKIYRTIYMLNAMTVGEGNNINLSQSLVACFMHATSFAKHTRPALYPPTCVYIRQTINIYVYTYTPGLKYRFGKM